MKFSTIAEAPRRALTNSLIRGYLLTNGSIKASTIKKIDSIAKAALISLAIGGIAGGAILSIAALPVGLAVTAISVIALLVFCYDASKAMTPLKGDTLISRKDFYAYSKLMKPIRNEAGRTQ